MDQQNQLTKTTKSNSRLLHVTALIIVIVLIIGSSVFVKKSTISEVSKKISILESKTNNLNDQLTQINKNLSAIENIINQKENQKIETPTKTINQIDSWLTYRNEEYGFTFDYPEDWIFDAKTTGGTYDILDIHLSNIQAGDGPSCTKGYFGFEIQIGYPKDKNIDFATYVDTDYKKLGIVPHGDKVEVKISNKIAYKFEKSGWSSGCKGIGFLIEQNEESVAIVFSGNDNIENANVVVDKIINTIIFE